MQGIARQGRPAPRAGRLAHATSVYIYMYYKFDTLKKVYRQGRPAPHAPRSAHINIDITDIMDRYIS